MTPIRRRAPEFVNGEAIGIARRLARGLDVASTLALACQIDRALVDELARAHAHGLVVILNHAVDYSHALARDLPIGLDRQRALGLADKLDLELAAARGLAVGLDGDLVHELDRVSDAASRLVAALGRRPDPAEAGTNHAIGAPAAGRQHPATACP